MDNVKFVDFEQNGETVTHAIIDNGDGSITSMLKSYYDAQIAAQNTLPSNSSIPQAGE
jgi:hypothetical protein